MSKLALVASAISSIINSPVKTYDECVADGLTIYPKQILDLDSFYKKTLIHIKIKDSVPTKTIPSPNIVKRTDYSPNIVKRTDYSPNIVKQTDYSPNIVKQTDYSPNIVKQTGYSPNIVKQTDYSPNIVKQTDYSSNIIKQTNSSPDVIKQTDYSPNTAKQIQIFIKPLVGDSQSMVIDPNITVLDFKATIHAKFGTDIKTMRLVFAGKQLEDYRTLTSYKVQKGCTIQILSRMLGGIGFYVIRQDLLDPSHNYNFTNLNDGGRIYVRGNEIYKRPYGWERIALNVGRYGSDQRWLGHVGNSRYEWPVSYHGTNREAVESIVINGYRLGEIFPHGTGIHSSPDVNVAEQHAVAFEHDGTRYKVVIQNRVNPEGLSKHRSNTTWLTPFEENMRPYGLCVKVASGSC